MFNNKGYYSGYYESLSGALEKPSSPLTGATFLLIGLADVEPGEHIRFTFRTCG